MYIHIKFISVNVTQSTVHIDFHNLDVLMHSKWGVVYAFGVSVMQRSRELNKETKQKINIEIYIT